MKIKRKKILLFLAIPAVLVILFVIFNVIIVLSSSCKGSSISQGTHSKGSLENGCRVPLQGNNFRFFSFFSYFILKDCYLNHRVVEVMKQAYTRCETSCPGVEFVLMETGDKDGGEQLLHRTHQNGLSIDFMVPLQKNGSSHVMTPVWKAAGYNLDFNAAGVCTSDEEVSIDFEMMARHLIALDDACRKNGMGIQRVIFNLQLKPALFATPSGKLLKNRGIYFAQRLTPRLNRAHDDHYHVDFALKR